MSIKSSVEKGLVAERNESPLGSSFGSFTHLREPAFLEGSPLQGAVKWQDLGDSKNSCENRIARAIGDVLPVGPLNVKKNLPRILPSIGSVGSPAALEGDRDEKIGRSFSLIGALSAYPKNSQGLPSNTHRDPCAPSTLKPCSDWSQRSWINQACGRSGRLAPLPK